MVMQVGPITVQHVYNGRSLVAKRTVNRVYLEQGWNLQTHNNAL